MPRYDRWETLRQLKFHKMQFCHYHIWIIIIIFFLHRRRGGGGQLQETGPGQAQQQTFLSGLELPVCGVTSAVSEGGPCEPSQFLFKNCLQREDKIENSFFSPNALCNQLFTS